VSFAGEAGVIRFHLKNLLECFRRLTLMMLDADIVVGPGTQSLRWKVFSRRSATSSSRFALEGTSFQIENIRMAYVFYASGLAINVLYTKPQEASCRVQSL
jgi:hypothetical protein